MNTDRIVCWGDSLTAGTGSAKGNDFPSQLSRLTGRPAVNAGIGGETSTQIVDRFLASSKYHNDTLVFFLGTNNSFAPNTIVADVARMVAKLAHQRYLIAGPLNRPYEYNYDNPADPHVQAYKVVVNAGEQLSVLYPGRWVDVRAALVAAYKPNQVQDAADHGYDVPPSSLRTAAVGTDDDGNGKSTVHLNDAGYAIVAKSFSDALSSLGFARTRSRIIGTPTAGEYIAVYTNGGILQNVTVSSPTVDPSKADDVFALAETTLIQRYDITAQ